MQDNNQTAHQSKMRNLMFAGGAILALIVVATVTALILKSIVPKKEAVTTVSVNAGETVALYGAPGAITGLSENLYDQQVNEDSSVPVVYKLGSHPYAVSTLTTDNVLFYGKSKSVQNDTKAIQDQTSIFMKAKGYRIIPDNVNPGSTSLTYKTYASDDAVCQLISSIPISSEDAEDIPVSHQLACATKAAIEQEYAQTEMFFSMYNGSKLPNFNLVTRTEVTEGDKSFDILQLKNGKAKSPTLLFAAVDKKWSYIADLNGQGESNGKYVITPEIKTKLNDSKYGGFLTHYIIGTTS